MVFFNVSMFFFVALRVDDVVVVVAVVAAAAAALVMLCCSFLHSFLSFFLAFFLPSFLPHTFLTPSSHLPSTRKRENKNPKEIALHDQRLSARQPVENMPRRSGQPQRFYQGRHLLCLSLVLEWQTQISTRT